MLGGEAVGYSSGTTWDRNGIRDPRKQNIYGAPDFFFFFSSFFFQAQHRYDLKNTVYDLHIFGQN